MAPRRNDGKTTLASRASFSTSGWFQKPVPQMSNVLSSTIPSIDGHLLRKRKLVSIWRAIPERVALRGTTIIIYKNQTPSSKFFKGENEYIKIYDVVGATAAVAVEERNQENFYPFKIQLTNNGKTLYFASECEEVRSRWLIELNAARVEYGPLGLRLIATIGAGHFGKVVLAQKRTCWGKDGLLALKEIKLSPDSALKGALTERILLASLPSHPFVITLQCSFRHGNYIYYGFDFKRGADLFEHVRRLGIKMDLDAARFYVSQVVLALRHLHKHNILYRDLKPENVLVDEFGNLCLADVGLSKVLPSSGRTFTICGTRSYLAPEMIETDPSGYGFSIDFWQLGCFLYELFAGRSPFWAPTKNTSLSRADSGMTAIRILKGQYTRPRHIDDCSWHLVNALLERQPVRRLGITCEVRYEPVIDRCVDLPGWDALAMHPFFSDVDWSAVYDKRAEPPHKPDGTDDNLVSNFGTRYLNQTPHWGDDDDTINGVNINFSLLHKDLLQGFGWVRPFSDYSVDSKNHRGEFDERDGTSVIVSECGSVFS